MKLAVLRLTALLALILTGTAWASAADNDAKISIKDGRITIVADGVTARKILEDWAKVGQIRMINVEKLTGPPLTLRLTDVTEKEALEVLLRSAAGYLAAPRAVDVPGASRFDRVVILATSRPPAASSAPPPSATVQPFLPQANGADDEEPPDEGEPLRPAPGPGGVQAPVFLPPNPVPFQGTGGSDAPPETVPVLTSPRPGVITPPADNRSTTPGGFSPIPGIPAVPAVTPQPVPVKKPGGSGS
jgi:hypothetical protein